MRYDQPRGSIWRKWDLHFHTPSSFDYKNKSVTNQEIIDCLISHQIAVVAITDHHYIDEGRIKELQSISSGRITILPGIELRTELGGSNSVHMIGIFPEDSDIQHIWNKLSCSLSITEKEVSAKGDERVYVDFRDASQEIRSLGGIVTAHAGSKTSGLEEISNKELFKQQVKTDLTKDFIDVLEISSLDDYNEYQNIVFKAIGFSRPLVICSDNHNVNEYCLSPITWIKADPTFRGLMQILYEPDERVCLGDDLPDIKPDYQVIDSVKINSPVYSDSEILFNPNMNVIIGGKSSGKSLLLGFIAQKSGVELPVKKDNDKYNEYVRSVLCDVSLKWRDGSEAERYLEYYPQTHINSLAAASDEIQDLLKSLIKADTVKAGILDDVARYNNRCRSECAEAISRHLSLLERMNEKKTELSTKGSKEGILLEIKKLNGEIEDIRKKSPGRLTDEEEAQFIVQVDRARELKSICDSLTNDIELLDGLKSLELLNDIDDECSELSDETKKKVENKYILLKQQIFEIWEKDVADIVKSTVDDKQTNQRQFNQIITSELYKKGYEFYKSNSTLKALRDRLETELNAKQIIETLEKDIEAMRSNLAENKDLIVNAHTRHYEYLLERTEGLTFTNQSLKIIPFISYKPDQFNTLVTDRIDKRSTNSKEYLDFEYTDINQFTNQMSRLFDSLWEGGIRPQTGYPKEQMLVEIFSSLYHDLEFDVDLQNDRLSDMSEGKKAYVVLKLLLEFSNLSCPILIDQPEDDLDNRSIYSDLALYIKNIKKKRQVIIVSHNPNVVIGSDTENVIVANQNGIGTNNIDNAKFQYISGSLETSFFDSSVTTILHKQGIREHVCEILEGGEEAFMKREKKLGYKGV